MGEPGEEAHVDVNVDPPGPIGQAVDGLRAAIGFLTRVPVGAPRVVMGHAAPWFPFVGLLIGLAQGGLYLGLRELLPPLPSAVVAVAAAALVTGAFHHDGLADMADAFGGGWTVEQRLTIMKDSRLGTYGTSALILAFATEISALSALDPMDGLIALVVAHTLSRSTAVLMMRHAPPAGS
ncbi:MAG: adenosylcobinamide-GDP ribazoletransferase, partial [Actinomycetota bacterium]